MGKVTGYTELTAGSSDDVLYIVDSGAGATPTSKKAKLETLLKAISSVGVVAAGASGAILYINSSKEPTWLAAGSSAQVLTIAGGAPSWAAAAGGGGSTAINLPAAAWQPTNNGSSWASAQLSVVQSGGSVPSPRWQEWLFDPTTIEYAVTTFIMPPNYAGASAAVLTVKYYSTAAVSSGVSWGVRIGGLPTSGAIQNWAFGATGAISTFAVPTTAYDLGSADITLTEGSSLLAAGNFQCIALYRNVGGGDSAAGDMHFVGAELKYS